MDFEEDDMGQTVSDWFKESRDHSLDWREEARENYDFYSGRQWLQDDIDYLRERSRPVITFNRVAPVINAISGFEISNRLEVRYVPRTLDDAPGNEMYTQTAQWARDEGQSGDEESEAFRDLLITGMGWTETWMDYEVNPDGFPNEARISPLEMYWDPCSKKQNLTDARYVIRALKLSSKEIKARWPDYYNEILENDKDEEMPTTHHTGVQGYQYNQGSNRKVKQHTVLQCQYWEKEPYYRFENPISGKIEEATPEKFEKINELIFQKTGLDLSQAAVKQMKRVYYQCFVSGKTLLGKVKPAPIKKRFTFQCMTGYRDETKGIWNGILNPMKDPQRWANKFFSQFLDIVSANAKGGLIAEEGAFKNQREAEEAWNDPSSLVHLNEGGLNKIQQRQIGPYPQSTDRLLQLAVGATRDVTGVNLEFLGLANRDQANSLEFERKKSVLGILADLFNSLQRFRKEQGKVLLEMIRSYMREGQLIRIVGKEQQQYVQFHRVIDFDNYDVVVDTAPDSPNMKQEVWSILQNIIPAAVKSGIPIPPSIVKFLPVPASVSAEWQAFLEGQAQPDPQVEQGKVLELKNKEADIQEKMSRTELNKAKAETITVPSEAQIATAMIKGRKSSN